MISVPRIAIALTIIVSLSLPTASLAAEATDVPVTETLTLAGLTEPVDIVRDQWGIPHVYASNLDDGAFALGYVMAVDRMFQMDIFRRIPSGTVSALLGFPDFNIGEDFPTDPPFPGNISNVEQDLFFKTLGLRRAAEDSFLALSPDVQSALQSFADGVNEYIAFANSTGNLPPEYPLLNISAIEPWVPVDSVVFGKLQAFQLSFDFDDGLTDEVDNVLGALGSPTGDIAFFDDLDRSQPVNNAFTVPDANNTPMVLTSKAAEKNIAVASADTKSEDASAGAEESEADKKKRMLTDAQRRTVKKAREYIVKLMKQPIMQEMVAAETAIGSNEWAVAGTHTDTGNPIVANDPHLGLGSPSTFYELHLNTKDRGGNINVTGIGFAGAPGVVLGHNEDISWGATTNPTDVTDWYLEDISSDGAGNLFSTYNAAQEPITRLPITVDVNLENGNLVGQERGVLALALGIPNTETQGVVDVAALLANFTPAEILIVDRHGPIFPTTLSPFPFPPNTTGGSALSVQYTGLFPTRELETFFIWNRATNLTEFKSGLAAFDFGSQNWAYADVTGNIAYFASGEFPIREDIDAGAVVGNPPYLIRDGTGGNEWKGLGGPQPADQAVPYEVVDPADVPQIENPAAGWFVNGNNDPVGNTADNNPLDEALAGTGPYLNRTYSDFRAGRITELVRAELNLIATPPGTPAGDGTISFADMQRMQADVNQIEGRMIAPHFVTAVDNALDIGAPPELSSLINSRILDARDRLNDWTYNTPAGFDTTGDPGIPTAQELIDSVATTIYNVAVGQLVENTFDATLAASGVGYRQGSDAARRGLLRLLNAPTFTGVGDSGINFFDDPGVSLTTEEERDILLVTSLQDALDLLAGPTFDDAFAGSLLVDDYLWGLVHYVVFESNLDGDLNNTKISGGGALSIPVQPAVGFPPGEPSDGARGTVDVASYGIRPTSDTGLDFGSGPNRRSVVEMIPGAIVAKNVIPGGTSGVVGDPHYGDQIDLWLSNGYHDVYLYTDDVVANAQSRTAIEGFGGCTEPEPGRCARGKGAKETDCIGEFFIDAPKDKKAFRQSKFEITDGDGFDFDRAGNNRCLAHVLLCVNNNDPRIVGRDGQQCASPDIETYELVRPKTEFKFNKPADAPAAAALIDAIEMLGSSTVTGDDNNVVEFSPALTDQDRCTTAYIDVPLKNGRKGKQRIKTRITRSDGTRDKDRMRIICNPSS